MGNCDSFNEVILLTPELFSYIEDDDQNEFCGLPTNSFVLVETPKDYWEDSSQKRLGSTLKHLWNSNQVPILTDEGIDNLRSWSSHPKVSGLIKSDSQVVLNSQFDLNSTLGPKFNEEHIGFFSSGSTGESKLIIHRLSSIFLALNETAFLLDPTSESQEFALTALPLHHVGGFLCFARKFHLGNQVTFCHSRTLHSLWKELQPNIVIGVPTQIIQALERGCPPCTYYCGGAGLNLKTWNRAIELDYEVLATYGLTESCGAIMYKRRPEDPLSFFPSVNVKLSKCEKGEEYDEGILSVKTNRMAHSIHTPNGVILNLSQEQFFDTNDKAILAHDHKIDFLQITGRKDQTIISGGENIDPAHIKSVLLKHFDTVIVMGIKHETLGELPVAFVSKLPHFTNEEEKTLWLSLISADFSKLARPRVIIEIPEYKGIKPSKQELQFQFDNRDRVLFYEVP